MSAGNFENLPL